MSLLSNKMNKRIFIKLVLCSVLVSTAFAVDFGGNVGFYSKIKKTKKTDYALNMKNNATAWFTVPFAQDNTNYLSAQGSVFYKYDDADIQHLGDKKTDVVFFDIDLLKWRYITKLDSARLVQCSAGRFGYSDSSGLVFGQPNDGIFAQYTGPGLTVSAYGGYTGLLNAQSVTILNKANSPFKYDTKKAYDWASPYWIGGVTVGLPFVFAQHSVEAQFLTAIGADGPSDSAKNSDYNRFYATAVLNGPVPVVDNTFYVFTTTFGSVDSDLCNLSQVTLSYFMQQYFNSTISCNTVYASGKQFGLKPFKGITSMTAVYDVAQSEYTGLVKSGLSASIKPISVLLLGAGGDVVFMYPDDTLEYSGVQVTANAKYQLLRDCNLSLFFARFMGKDSDTTNTEVTLKAVLAF
ncbi:MAG: hypothetical protein K6E51_12675 [Treponema sp.]|nr:hypothetical protein [Treponema sp.]